MHTQAAIFRQFSRGSENMAFHKRMAQFGQSIQHSCGLKQAWSHLSPKFQAASSEWVLASKSSMVHHKTRFSLVFVLKLDTLIASDLISKLRSWTGHPQFARAASSHALSGCRHASGELAPNGSDGAARSAAHSSH